MPEAYQHLRVRLRAEQVRLLAWGKEIGILQVILDQPSQDLGLNRNLVIDILLEIQALFKSCLKMQSKYDKLVPPKTDPLDVAAHLVARSPSTLEDVPFSTGNCEHQESPTLLLTRSEGSALKSKRPTPQATGDLLARTLKFFQKAPEAVKRLQWAAVSEANFASLVEKLIGYNDTVESLLDTHALQGLRFTMDQSYMAMLQLNTKVDDLKIMCSALQVPSEALPSYQSPRSSPENSGVLQLASFKAQLLSVDSSSSAELAPLKANAVQIKTSDPVRCEAIYNGRRVWIEWKKYVIDQSPGSQWNKVVEARVKKLAILLGSDNKPEQFRAPKCCGYFDDKTLRDGHRYGLLYEKPADVPPTTEPSSLSELFMIVKKPSLTKRVALARAAARCIFHLHAVNWLHKGVRSDSIVFFMSLDTEPDYHNPILCGFDYARPDMSEEQTEPPFENHEHDFYRHPRSLGNSLRRSRKTFDMYSLGIVLVEIAFWKHMKDIIAIPEDPRAARKTMRNIRRILLGDGFRASIEESMGEHYFKAIARCFTGTEDLPIDDELVESDGEAAAELQQVFFDDVIKKLDSIVI